MAKAIGEDFKKDNQKRQEEALAKCKEMVIKLGLKMKPLAAHYDSEANHFTVFFRAEQRVDFRELVWKLRHSLKARVELRQIGPRDEAKLIGGIGKCGYPLCCQNFLGDFASVSIKMAKEQGLALNPMKISGVCGRLLCCLSYESKDYAETKKILQPVQEISPPRDKAIGDNTDNGNSMEPVPNERG